MPTYLWVALFRNMKCELLVNFSFDLVEKIFSCSQLGVKDVMNVELFFAVFMYVIIIQSNEYCLTCTKFLEVIIDVHN
jgi:hypothetical protein